MRRLAACLILSLILAAPVGAQQGRIANGQPTQDQAALRGSQSVTPPPAQADLPLLLPLPVQPTSISASSSSGGQCRLSCSREYYFCLAGEDSRCPQYWSRCVSGCGA